MVRTVFDGDRIRASLFNEGASKLCVTFRQRIDRDGAFSDPEPVKSFVNDGYAHLFIQSRFNDWYINDETRDLEAALERLASNYRKNVAMGFSMGGYAALRFSKSLRLNRLIAVSAQVSIDPDRVPWDPRYRKYADGFDAALGDLMKHRRSGAKGCVVFDPLVALDRRNAYEIEKAFPNLDVLPLCGGGHPATYVLRMAGRFGLLQRELKNPSPKGHRILKAYRGLRHESPYYWQNLAEAALKRGKNTLCETAMAQANAILAKESDDISDSGS